MTDLEQKIAFFSEETKRLEQAHRQLQEKFYSLKNTFETSLQILDTMSDGLIFVDLKGVITLYNPALARILDVQQEEVIGRSFWELFSDTLFGFPLANALKTGYTPGRVLLTLSNGYEISVSPNILTDKGLFILVNDRTELKQLEQAAQQADRLKALGEMAASLAHEIRNPLGGIEGFAALLKRDIENKEQRGMLDAILEGSRTLNTLVTNVLEYARPLALHFVPTDLAFLLKETATLAGANGQRCEILIEKQHVRSIDPKRVQLILLNLIRNSYESGATNVRLVLTKEGMIEVRDDGSGIASDTIEKMFTPFFTTKASGTGLGLCEAHKVMRAHGGNVLVDSKVGKGTCITLSYGH